MVEFQPSKLAVVGSNPIARSNDDVRREAKGRGTVSKDDGRVRFTKWNNAGHSREAHVAQLVEHVLGKDEVTRSIRVVGSKGSVIG